MTPKSNTSDRPSHTSLKELSEKFNIFFTIKVVKIRQQLDENSINTETTTLLTDSTPSVRFPLSTFTPTDTQEIKNVLAAIKIVNSCVIFMYIAMRWNRLKSIYIYIYIYTE